jgi:hypothetical protein
MCIVGILKCCNTLFKLIGSQNGGGESVKPKFSRLLADIETLYENAYSRGRLLQRNQMMEKGE